MIDLISEPSSFFTPEHQEEVPQVTVVVDSPKPPKPSTPTPGFGELTFKTNQDLSNSAERPSRPTKDPEPRPPSRPVKDTPDDHPPKPKKVAEESKPRAWSPVQCHEVFHFIDPFLFLASSA